MRKFTIAIIGCGTVSRLHAAAYTRHPERLEVVAVCDPLVDRAEELARSFPNCRPFGSVADAVRFADWEIGVVCSPTPVRTAVVDELAAAGKHVFVEKPLADNIADATRMVECCERAGTCLAVHQNFRYHYPFDIARDLIKAGAIGRVTMVTHRELLFRQDRGWRTSSARHSLAVMGIHWLDGFRWMLADEPADVVCSLYSSPLIDAAGDTDAAVYARFTAGATVSYVQSFSCSDRALETSVIGDEGSLRMQHGELTAWRVAGRDAPDKIHRVNPPGGDKPEATFLAIDQVLQAIEQDRAPSNSGRDNLGTVAFLEAAYRSAEFGKLVPVTAELVP